MNAQAKQRDWFDDIVQQNITRVAFSDAPWLKDARDQARHALSQAVLPERRLEGWRYSDIAGLYEQHYRYPQAMPDTLPAGVVDNWIYPGSASHRLVFVNGRYVPSMSRVQALPHGAMIGSLRAMLDTAPERVSACLERFEHDSTDIFSELNRAFIDDGLFVLLPANAIVDDPIEVVYLNLAEKHELLSQPRSLIMLEANSRARLVERFIGSGASSCFFNGVTSVALAADAFLQHTRLQHEQHKAHHLSRIALHQQAASQYRGIYVSTGAGWSRTDIQVLFEGPHAVCELDGLYSVGDRQHTDFHLDVRHEVPYCRSREDFKGIVYGNGRAVFDGKVLVEQDAQKTDAQLSNKNLLLSQNGEVDTKPQLEILADDVKCSHGTTVGKIDPAQLYYLRSRGIEERQARQMICLGFAEQVLSHIDDEILHDYVHARIADLFDRQAALL